MTLRKAETGLTELNAQIEKLDHFRESALGVQNEAAWNEGIERIRYENNTYTG